MFGDISPRLIELLPQVPAKLTRVNKLEAKIAASENLEKVQLFNALPDIGVPRFPLATSRAASPYRKLTYVRTPVRSQWKHEALAA